MALEYLKHEFESDVRMRGSVYHRDGAVQVLAHSAEVIRATVKGSQTYGVKFQRRFRVFCRANSTRNVLDMQLST
jgi:uncharacterized Zn finger protein